MALVSWLVSAENGITHSLSVSTPPPPQMEISGCAIVAHEQHIEYSHLYANMLL